LLLDTSCCGKIRDSKNRGLIEAHLDEKFRRVLSVQTFWELLDAIDGGDGTHFEKDRELLRIAAGNPRKLLVLPTPVSFAIQHVLKRPAPRTPLRQETYQLIFSVVMKAKDRDQLYSGVRMPGAVNQRKAFDPTVVRKQQSDGELQYMQRLKRGRLQQLPMPSSEQWVSLLAKDLGVTVSQAEARKLATGFDAAYRFYEEVWKMALNLKNTYNVEKHKNDWIDMQQTMHLCDDRLYLITCDRGIITKTKGSPQATRILYLPTYLSQIPL
jgi:hypothetical protein